MSPRQNILGVSRKNKTFYSDFLELLFKTHTLITKAMLFTWVVHAVFKNTIYFFFPLSLKILYTIDPISTSHDRIL